MEPNADPNGAATFVPKDPEEGFERAHDDNVPSTLWSGSNLLGLALRPPEEQIAAAQSRPQQAAVGGSSLPSAPHSPPSTHSNIRSSVTPCPSSARHTGTTFTPIMPPPRTSSHHPTAPRYTERSHSTASVTPSDRSFGSTVVPSPITPSSSSGPATQVRLNTPNEWGGRKSSLGPSRPRLMSSLSSGSVLSFPMGKKRTSRQVFAEIGKGLGRMGSVIRRNTSDGSGTASSFPMMDKGGRSRCKKGKAREMALPEEEEGWIRSAPGFNAAGSYRRRPVPGDGGNAGIGRPFNVEHDLHVSLSLEDLPPAWLESLRKQGLSEQDLMLIAATRKKQAAGTKQALRPIKVSLPPMSTHSSPLSMGNLMERDTTRIRGMSTPVTPVAAAMSGQHGTARKAGPAGTQSGSLVVAAEAKNDLPGPGPRINGPSEDRAAVSPHSRSLTLGQMLADEPEPLSPRTMVETSDSTDDLMDLGGERRRTTPKRNKRISDQLLCFSRFDLGGDESWGESLITAITGQPPRVDAQPTDSCGPQRAPKEKKLLEIVVPERQVITILDKAEGAGEVIKASPRQVHSNSGSKRIPLPPLCPATTPEEPITLDTQGTPEAELPWPSPPPPPPQRGSVSVPDVGNTGGKLVLRRPSESFGVHYSTSRSSDDLNLITPSTSQELDEAQTSPEELNGSDSISIGSQSSDLDFETALREGGYDLTPQSSFSDKLREFLPSPPPRKPDASGCPEDPQATASTSPRVPARMSHPNPNPASSVPASVHSSLPSRPSTPDHSFSALHPSLFTIAQSPTTPVSQGRKEATTPRWPYDERASVALSLLSSEDSAHLHNSLHEATVQMAYTKMLGRLAIEKKVEGDARGSIKEESEGCGEREGRE